MAPELCVSAVVIDDERLLLVRRGRGRAQGAWAVPGGRVQAGELLAEAVVRELREETGIEGVCGNLVGVLELLDDEGPHQVVLAHFVTLMEAVEPVAGDDAAEARWVPLSDVAELRLATGLAEFLHDHQVIATIT
ncbi:NUDIX hydrolase [Aquihabitans daechungensis]|uniref:NUDIX hydrolase n=1 Tax=Aquihabitans daechungensis TaxID=1052257 RepID=UPI003B9F7EAF